MAEKITTYLLPNFEDPIPMDRDEFYAEQIAVYKKTGKPTRSVEVIQILLFTPEGEIILQKRSKSKKHNPNMFDKSIGGHVAFGDSPQYTVMCETLQELEVPAFVLHTRDEFTKTYRLLERYISRSALLQYIATRTYTSQKKINDELVGIANTYHLYFGVYQGAIRPADKESAGIVFYDMETLRTERTENPNLFTADLMFFLQKYDTELDTFLRSFSR